MISLIFSTIDAWYFVQAMKSTRGSVLMEFVIVMPVYFLLIGFAFVVGELSLHSIHLAAFADRGVAWAYDGDDITKSGFSIASTEDFFAELKNALSFDREWKEVDYSYDGSDVGGGRANVSQLESPEHIDVVPNDGIDGHFTKAVAGGLVDHYALTPLSRGFAAFWVHETERRVYDGETMSSTLDRPDEGPMDVLLKKGTLGRTEMSGNYRYDNFGEKVREYGHYSLQRNLSSYWQKSGGEGDDEHIPYRGWDSGALNERDTDKDIDYWEYAADSGVHGTSERIASVKIDADSFIKENNLGARPSMGKGDGLPAHKFSFHKLFSP